jgi:hypothetical protein
MSHLLMSTDSTYHNLICFSLSRTFLNLLFRLRCGFNNRNCLFLVFKIFWMYVLFCKDLVFVPQ